MLTSASFAVGAVAASSGCADQLMSASTVKMRGDEGSGKKKLFLSV